VVLQPTIWLFNWLFLQVESWFTRLISDQDVLDSTKIDIKILANIVAQTGATVDAFDAFFYKNEQHEKTLIDIVVLGFPDIDNPHFKVGGIVQISFRVVFDPSAPIRFIELN
jgi:hypothetical protein